MKVVLDEEDRAYLLHQWDLLQVALHPKDGPPDRKEAALIRRRMDAKLDGRRRPVAVAPDGEVLWRNDVSPWVADQANFAVNTTGEAERVTTKESS